MTSQSQPITINPVLNGLTYGAQRRKTGRIKFIDIVPPIEQECTDEKHVQSTFEKYPLIPYSGNSKITSHRMVNLLYNLKNMSPTFGGVIQMKKAYAIGTKIEIIKQRDLVFNIGDDVEIPISEKIKFRDLLNEYFIWKQGDIKKVSECASDSWDSTGMIGIHVVTSFYLGVTKVVVKYEHPTDFVFYKNAEYGTEVAISKCWDDFYLDQNPPDIVPVFPLERVDRDGSIHTFFYVKNGGYIYGRPSDMSALHDKYSEYKLKQLVSKTTKKSFAPNVMIEYEDGQMSGGLIDDDAAKENGYLSGADRVNDRFTNDGDDPQGVFVTTRPKGASPALVYEFATFKNAKDLNEYLRECEETILNAGNLPELLYKLSGTTGFSNQVFMDVFNIYNVTFNEQRQLLLETLFNSIINYGFSKLNIDNTIGIGYKTPIQILLDEYNNGKRGSEIQSGIKDFERQAKTNL